MLNVALLHPASSATRAAPGNSLCAERGFNLVELLVTLSIGSILMAIAAPSFSSLIANQRTKGAASDIYMALIKTRSEALKRNASVTLSKTGPSAAWSEGWQIVDAANTNTKLEDFGPVKNVTITGPTNVTYRASGRITADAEPVFSIKASNSDKQWCVSVDLSGRPYQKSIGANSTCSS